MIHLYITEITSGKLLRIEISTKRICKYKEMGSKILLSTTQLDCAVKRILDKDTNPLTVDVRIA